MQKRYIDPWAFGLAYGIRQGVLVEGGTRVLYCAGQAAVDAEGAPQHAGDMGAQIELALDNVAEVLNGAGMGLDALVRLNIFTTDLDAFYAAHHRLKARLAAAGAAPPGTLVEVRRLGAPTVMVELEATAVG